jgi:hypothetical protein
MRLVRASYQRCALYRVCLPLVPFGLWRPNFYQNFILYMKKLYWDRMTYIQLTFFCKQKENIFHFLWRKIFPFVFYEGNPQHHI